MSSLSMATSTVPYPLFTKRSDLSLTQSLIPLPTHFVSIPSNTLKPLKLHTHIPNSLYLLSVRHFHRVFSALNSFEVSEDDDIAIPDDPETETEEYEDEGEEEEEEERKPKKSKDEGRLYVGNLPYSLTSSQLTEIFEEAGGVVKAEIIYDRVTDRSRGFGFVTMASVEEAKEAIRMFNESQIGGRTVAVNFPEVPKGGEREVMRARIRSSYRGFINSPYKIYAGNLSWSLTSQDLKDAFANQPGVLSAKVVYERDSGRSRGFGFVSFENAEAAEAALDAMDRVEVQGRPLLLNLAQERAGTQPQDGNAVYNLESSELLSNIGS